MINEFEALSKQQSKIAYPSIENISKYLEKYSQLANEYKDKIQYLLDYEKALREERNQMEERYIEIHKKLINAGFSPEIADEQLSKMKEDMERSFSTSFKIIESFYSEKLACFDEKFKQIYLHGGDE